MRFCTRLAAAVSLSVLTAACGSPERSFEYDRHRLLQGTLESNVLEVQSSEWVEECDLAAKSRQLEIARALDSRQSGIDRFARSLPPSKAYRIEDLGPIFVRERLTRFRPRPGWVVDRDGWGDLHAEYLRIRDLPVGPEWLALNLKVRALVLDDRMRILDGANLYLDRDSGPAVLALAGAVGSCAVRDGCTEFSVPAGAHAFAESNPMYADYLRWYREGGGRDELRKKVEAFARRLRADARRFEFRLNKALTRPSRGELSVALDPGLLDPAREKLASYIEKVWSADGLALRVKWVLSDSFPDAFRIFAETVTGGRSYVLEANRTVHLFPGVSAGSIAHEIGHVLGFRDHYYTVWKPQDCAYETQSRDEDIMSHSDGGVLDEEWAELESAYPL